MDARQWRDRLMLETPRLLLRPFAPDDVETVVAIIADERTRRFLFAGTSADEKAFIASQIAMHQAHGIGFIPVVLKETGALIGYCGLRHIPHKLSFTPAVDIGWVLSPDHWGKGYATEAAAAWLRHGFETLRFDEIVAYTATGNLASRAIMDKLGMRRDETRDFNHPKGQPDRPDIIRQVLYAMTKEEWRARLK